LALLAACAPPGPYDGGFYSRDYELYLNLTLHETTVRDISAVLGEPRELARSTRGGSVYEDLEFMVPPNSFLNLKVYDRGRTLMDVRWHGSVANIITYFRDGRLTRVYNATK
jgi:hypothetical protein